MSGAAQKSQSCSAALPIALVPECGERWLWVKIILNCLFQGYPLLSQARYVEWWKSNERGERSGRPIHQKPMRSSVERPRLARYFALSSVRCLLLHSHDRDGTVGASPATHILGKQRYEIRPVAKALKVWIRF
jgi:hypothetical protein